MNQKCYEEYPFRIVLLTNLVSMAIYAAGAFIIYQIGLVWLILYLLYIAWLEIRLLKRSCTNCYYYGKACAFGKGKLSCLFFKKGSPDKFKQDKIAWKDLLPDLLVSLIPVLLGVILLIVNFSWLLLSIIILLMLLSSVGNGLVRGSLACKYCRQREIGCPAVELFSRKRGENARG